MKPYGWRVPYKHQYLCNCRNCRDEISNPRQREEIWAKVLIEEQLADPMDGQNPCADGTCEECNAMVADLQKSPAL